MRSEAHHDSRAIAREFSRHRAPDATRGTGHDAHFVCEMAELRAQRLRNVCALWSLAPLTDFTWPADEALAALSAADFFGAREPDASTRSARTFASIWSTFLLTGFEFQEGERGRKRRKSHSFGQRHLCAGTTAKSQPKRNKSKLSYHGRKCKSVSVWDVNLARESENPTNRAVAEVDKRENCSGSETLSALNACTTMQMTE